MRGGEVRGAGSFPISRSSRTASIAGSPTASGATPSAGSVFPVGGSTATRSGARATVIPGLASTFSRSGSVPSASATTGISGAIPSATRGYVAPAGTTAYRNGVYVTVGSGGSYYRYYPSANYGSCYPYYSYRYSCSYPYYPYYGCGPGFSFSFGYPYWSFYYASYYPYYCYPYYRGYPYYYPYPYYSGAYVGSYSPPVYVDRSYVYHDAPAPVPGSGSEPAVVEEVKQPGEAAPTLPEAEVSDAAREALSGLAEFRGGRYAEASESLFAAAQAEPKSEALKVYLAHSLFAIGEYSFAADYLRRAIETRPVVTRLDFSVSRLYDASPQGEEDLKSHYAQLTEWVRLRPYDTDALLVLGFVQLNTSRAAEAAVTFAAMRDHAASPEDKELAERLYAEAVERLAPGAAREQVLPPGSPAEVDRLGEVLGSALD